MTKNEAIAELIKTIKSKDSLQIDFAWEDFKARIIANDFTRAPKVVKAPKTPKKVKTVTQKTILETPVKDSGSIMPDIKTHPAGLNNAKPPTH